MLPSRSPLGHYLEFRNNPLAVLMRTMELGTDLAMLRVAHKHLYVVHHPQAIRQILVKQAASFVRESGSPAILRPALGRGMLTTSGDEWSAHRHTAQPAFQRKAVDPLVPQIVEVTDELLVQWTRAAATGETVTLLNDLMALTFRIGTATLFGYGASAHEARDFVHALTSAQAHFFARLVNGYPMPLWLPGAPARNAREAVACLEALVDRIIDSRRTRAPGSEPDYFDRVAAAARATTQCPVARLRNLIVGAEPSQMLRAAIMTMLIAAPENPSNALSWALYLLARHPAIEAAVRQEVIGVLGERNPSLEGLARMKLLSCVLHETLRLYPGAWAFEREATEDQELCGYRIPRGALMVLSPYLVHRNPRFWKDPERFDPARFADRGQLPEDKQAYFPFGSGRRQCIGSRFALLEMQVALAMILRRFRVQPTPDCSTEVWPMFTLRPRHGLTVKLEALASATAQAAAARKHEAVHGWPLRTDALAVGA